jgi:hypothetical protein
MPFLSSTTALVAVVALTALACEAEAGGRRSRPLRTGQRTCWSEAGFIVLCAGTGQDGELRRGEPRAYTDNGDGTIRDERTALTWEKLSDDGSIHDVDNRYTWPHALRRIGEPNKAGFGGFDDWRLPNLNELETLRDLGLLDPAISTPFDTDCQPGCSVAQCSCTASSHYWSSSTHAHNPTDALAVFFGSGWAFPRAKTTKSYVRALRGGS